MDKSRLLQPDEVNENTPFLFVSYSRKDIDQVQEVLQILRHNHFRFWYDMGLKSGAEWAEALGEKIEQCSQFMVIISENSMESKYVRKEINMAVDIKNDGQILVLYLKDIMLPRGLHFLLGNLQAISRQEYSEENDFANAICQAISNEILSSSVGTDTGFFEESKWTCDFDNVTHGDTVCSVFAENSLMNNYIINQKIGQGGFGEVYLGEHRRTGVPVAIKRGTLDNTYRGAVIRQVFKNELDILGKKLVDSCANIPFVLDWYEDDSNVFLVLSYIKGTSLKQIRRNYTESQLLNILKKLLNILGNIHNHGIIYKDLKPDNVIENEYGELFLVDFNIASEIEHQSHDKIAGTPGYCPPEQLLTAKEEQLDYSSDIYALGRLLEKLILQDKFDRSGQKIPVRAYRKDISVEFENIILRMTELEKNKRFQSVDDVVKSLESLQRTGLVKKIMNYFISEQRSRVYFTEIQKSKQIREEYLKEMADLEDVSQVFDTNSNNMEAEHTVFF